MCNVISNYSVYSIDGILLLNKKKSCKYYVIYIENSLHVLNEYISRIKSTIFHLSLKIHKTTFLRVIVFCLEL